MELNLSSFLKNLFNPKNQKMMRLELSKQWMQKANEKYLKGYYNSAIKLYSKIIVENAFNYEALFNRGMAYHDLGMYDAAVADFTKAIELKQDFSEAYKCRALSYYSLNENQKALQDYNVAVRLVS